MAPTITPFHPADLESKIRILPTGKLRKPPNQQDLSECKLMEIMQFNCDVVKHSKHKNGIVICEPIQRVFRR
jgi:inner membrane protease subunit SOM1